MGITLHHRLHDDWRWDDDLYSSIFKDLYCKLYRKIYFPNQWFEYFSSSKYSDRYRWCAKNCIENSWTTWNNRIHTGIGFGFKNKKDFLHFKMVWM